MKMATKPGPDHNPYFSLTGWTAIITHRTSRKLLGKLLYYSQKKRRFAESDPNFHNPSPPFFLFLSISLDPAPITNTYQVT